MYCIITGMESMAKPSIDLKWKGKFTLRAYDKSGKLVHEQTTDNILTNVGKDIVHKYLVGIVDDGEINKIGVGDGNANPVFGDEELDGANTTIKDIDDRNYVRPNAVVGVTYDFAEANYVWREAGLFAGTVLVGRALVNPVFTKTNLLRTTGSWTTSLG